ncbi:MAG: chorismate synthase [Bacteroidales bacterium]|nr:chorismate synthase [Bacteroidales bacterium]
MNTIGNTFRLTTFGESHGAAVGGTIDGCPAGLLLDEAFIISELTRRRLGDQPSTLTTSRSEPDQVEWLSGVFQGKTLGTPLTFIVRNQDCRSSDYDALRTCYRPGHADYTTQQKYGYRDHRGGGRSSGRETVARVVAGSVAKQLLKREGVTITASSQQHLVSCIIKGVHAGLGDPIFDRLNARLAFAVMSIPSAMSFSMGETPDCYKLDSFNFPDAWCAYGEGENLTATNHCGGVQGGISNGMPIIFHVGFHPPVTNPDGMICRQEDGSLEKVAPHGRHDAEHFQRLPVIVESMAAITLADLYKF